MVNIKFHDKHVYAYFCVILALGLLTFLLVQYRSSSSSTHLTRKLSRWRSSSRLFIEIRSSTTKPMTDQEKLLEIANILNVHGNLEEEVYHRMLIEIVILAQNQRKQRVSAKDTIEEIHNMILHHTKNSELMERLLEDMDVLDNLLPKKLDRELSVYPFKKDTAFTPSVS